MTRCELVRCTACKTACIRKGRENQANAKLFATLNNAIRHGYPSKVNATR